MPAVAVTYPYGRGMPPGCRGVGFLKGVGPGASGNQSVRRGRVGCGWAVERSGNFSPPRHPV